MGEKKTLKKLYTKIKAVFLWLTYLIILEYSVFIEKVLGIAETFHDHFWYIFILYTFATP